MLYYLTLRQRKTIAKVHAACTGYACAPYTQGYYPEPEPYFENRPLLVRFNVENNRTGYARDYYVDYYGDVYTFDNAEREVAHEAAPSGRAGLIRLTLAGTGRYFNPDEERLDWRRVVRTPLAGLDPSPTTPEDRDYLDAEYRTRLEREAAEAGPGGQQARLLISQGVTGAYLTPNGGFCPRQSALDYELIGKLPKRLHPERNYLYRLPYVDFVSSHVEHQLAPTAAFTPAPLYYVPARQTKLRETILQAFEGYGYTLYSEGMYLEPPSEAYFENNFLLLRLNFEDNYRPLRRDFYLDYYGDAYLFEGESCRQAGEAARRGHQALRRLVLEEGVGYYFALSNFEHRQRVHWSHVAHASLSEIIERCGPARPKRSVEENFAAEEEWRREITAAHTSPVPPPHKPFEEMTEREIKEFLGHAEPPPEILATLKSGYLTQRGSSSHFEDFLYNEISARSHTRRRQATQERIYLVHVPYYNQETNQIETR